MDSTTDFSLPSLDTTNQAGKIPELGLEKLSQVDRHDVEFVEAKETDTEQNTVPEDPVQTVNQQKKPSASRGQAKRVRTADDGVQTVNQQKKPLASRGHTMRVRTMEEDAVLFWKSKVDVLESKIQLVSKAVDSMVENPGLKKFILEVLNHN